MIENISIKFLESFLGEGLENSKNSIYTYNSKPYKFFEKGGVSVGK